MRNAARVALSLLGLAWAGFALGPGEVLPTLSAQSPTAAGVRLRAVEPNARTGRSAAVVVEEGSLVHTAQLYPVEADGRVHGGADAYAQAAHVLGNTEKALKAGGSGLDRIVRLHVYVAEPSVTAAVDRLIAERFGSHQPAVTLVESRMPQAGVLVAMDAVGATASRAAGTDVARIAVTGLPSSGSGAHVAIQPDGPFVIVSGRAAQGEFDAAVRGTMEQLRADLKGVGLDFNHVVQVKSFLTDMSRAERLRQLVAEALPGTAPPQVVTEWRDGSLPVEIELVATARGAAGGGERLTFVEPISARYSRVARVFAGRPVFISGLTGTSAEPTAQVREIFAEARRLLDAAGSDMRHIAKATYYVSDKAADQEINNLRPSIYDAARPPAASKISVAGTGRPGQRTVIDMIAVTVGR